MFRSLALFALVSTGLSSAHAAPTNPYVIYGTDDRKDVYEEQDASRRALADSVAAMVSTSNIKTTRTGYELVYDTLGEANNLCSTEKFVDQITPADCTGFLVADDVIATAGHCVMNHSGKIDPNYCKNNRIVFGFNIDRKGKDPSVVAQDDVYSCTKVLHAEQDFQSADFALIKLDRKVTGRTPVRFMSQAPSENDALFMIGHPVGLPAKIADGAKVRSIETNFFVANLDSFGGNSGSPVFNAATNEIAGILVRGEQDFARKGSCNISYRCKNQLCRGEDVTTGAVVANKLRAI